VVKPDMEEVLGYNKHHRVMTNSTAILAIRRRKVDAVEIYL